MFEVKVSYDDIEMMIKMFYKMSLRMFEGYYDVMLMCDELFEKSGFFLLSDICKVGFYYYMF